MNHDRRPLESDARALGLDLRALLEELFPLCRSITGEGLRQTLRVVKRELPGLRIHEIPSGTEVLDWEVPKEWNLREAWITGPSGHRIVDTADSNLHVVNYSVPVRRRLSLEELQPHLHSLPDRPDWIPYRTSYYRQDWGFCLPHRQREALEPGSYEVCIDARLEPGSLSYGELLLPGDREEEVLFTTHACHPSMANDNLSGVVVLMALARVLQEIPRRYTYRLLWMPGTIGAITWLAAHRDEVERVRHGLVLAGLGDAGDFTYKRSRRNDARIDQIVANALRDHAPKARIVDFSPYGYDERQFNSPGFRLPVGRLSRSEWGSYPEYHTSADDLDFVADEQLEGALRLLQRIVVRLEGDRRFRNTVPYGEPQLGRRGLYDETGEIEDWERVRSALLWVLNLSDGEHALLDVAERSGLPFEAVAAAAARLRTAGLLEPVRDSGGVEGG